MQRVRHDLRVALRGLRRTPSFVIAVLAILGLGIGMAVAMFTTLNAILLRRLPIVDQDRVVVLWPYQVPNTELAPPATDLPELRLASRMVSGIAGVAHFGTWTTPLLDGDRTITLATTPVSGNYFAVLGARPALGRLLRPEDETPGAPYVMVLSYGLWQAQFGGSLSVIGRQLVEPYSRGSITVVGVGPPGLDYPVGVGAWTPIVRGAAARVFVVARLAPGASADAARAEYFSIISRLEPSLNLTGAGAKTFTQAVLGDATPILLAVAAAVGLLLLIACVNVGALSLVRAASRVRELAVRRALGASYADLVRQLVVESALLAIAGGALGLACAAVLLRAFVRLAPSQLPRLDDIRLHGGLLGSAIGVTAFAVLLVGVLPALAAARVNLASSLRADARSGAETRQRRRVRQCLVAAQIALAVVMLAGAGILTRSLQRLERLPLGYRAEHLSIVSLALDATRYDSQEKWYALGEQLEQRVRAIPGVIAVTPIETRPFDGAAINIGRFEGEGQTPAAIETNPVVPWEVAGADYFRALAIGLLSGRGFLESDREGAPPVVVVSESVARRFWPGQHPIGKRLRWTPFKPAPGVVVRDGFFDWRTVVGVAPDTRLRELRDASPTVYLPWRQWGWSAALLAVRSSPERAGVGIAAAMREAAREVDPTLTIWNVQSMDELLGGPLAQPRATAMLLAGFALVALTLAAVGLYGAMTQAVREQTREIGIRVALGATPTNIRDAVFREALVIVAAGSGLGVAGALGTTRLLQALLFEVSPTDPMTLGAVCGLLSVVAALAAYLPARRATRIDPVRALRSE